MNANNINSVVVTLNGTSKKIEVRNGMILVLTGNGPMDGAFWTKLEDASDAGLSAAKEVSAEDFNPTPWGDSLDNDVVDTPDDDVVDAPDDDESYKHSFNDAVNFLAHCSGEKFLKYVRYAKTHGNRFFYRVKEIAAVVNADDAYCSALIQLARPLGEVVEHNAFELFELALEDKNVEDFLDMWKSLQTISYFCD